MRYGLIGEKLGHSFSAIVHAELAGYDYQLKELQKGEMDAFMQAADFAAINVTIPYKKAVIPYLSYMSEDAKRIGAVNTVVNRDGKLYGYNTDFGGMQAMLKKSGIDVLGKKVAVLGTGGTSLTAQAVVTHLGAVKTLVVSRTKTEATVTYEELAKAHADTQIIVNTTPVGMFPNTDGCPVNLDDFPHLTGVVDAVYNPLKTELVRAAQSRGIPAVGGLYMLVAQAALAVEHFIGKNVDKAQIDAIYQKIANKQRNVVLIGMPGSGKSTLGRMLAQQLEKRFFDSDEQIRQTTGLAPAQIITEQGESVFRDLEEQSIATLANVSGAVIATGGGAILRQINVQRIKRNGVVVFIDRPIDKLKAGKNRPLSADRAALEKRYAERYDKYVAAADVVIKPTLDKQENVQMMMNALQKVEW